MTLMRTFVVSSTVVALVFAPAALAQGKPDDPGKPDNKGTQNAAAHQANQANQPGPNASLPAKAKAYGVHCQGQSKRQAPGQHAHRKGAAQSDVVHVPLTAPFL